MKISHEVPLALLEKSREFNDYDYALVHLFETHPDYYQFFVDSLKQGRHVLLDNSLFELGKSFNPAKFAEYVVKLKPTEYVIPDVWNDGPACIQSFKDFVSEFPDLPGKTIGVVQGATEEEWVECYIFMSENADKIAMSFGIPLFKKMYENTQYSDDLKLMNGRVTMIHRLQQQGIWRGDKPHHLLGCALPQEFVQYRHLKNIDTIDTSNPIMAGINGLPYGDRGLDEKPLGKLADHLDEGLSKTQLDLVYGNVKAFRRLVEGE
jgi:hypothetical protein